MFGKGKHRQRPPEAGNKSELGQDARSVGREGQRNAEVTPKIGPGGNPGQTSHAAPPGDVGVPPDEELGRERELGGESHQD
jgi:hypothetical protein